MFAITYLFVLLSANQALCGLLDPATVGKLCFFCQDFTFNFGVPNAPGSVEAFNKSSVILPFQSTTTVHIPIPVDDIVGVSVTIRALFAPEVNFDLASTTVVITYSKLQPATSVYHIKAYVEQV